MEFVGERSEYLSDGISEQVTGVGRLRRSRRRRRRDGPATLTCDGGDAGVDRGDAGESVDRLRVRRTVHGDGDVQ